MLATPSDMMEIEKDSKSLWSFDIVAYELNTLHVLKSFPYEYSQVSEWDPFDSNLLLMLDTLRQRMDPGASYFRTIKNKSNALAASSTTI